MTERWFGSPHPGPEAEVLLFCLPYAGGGALAYRRWPVLLAPGVGVEPVLLPGRERRIGEPAAVDPAALADAVQRRADRPFAIYGHSMGARLGFELTVELRARGAALPLRLAVGAARPPDEFDPLLGIVELPDDDFVEELVALGGTSDEVLAHPELRELLLPALRADFGWLRDLRPPAGEPLPVPIDGYLGSADLIADAVTMAGWARHTSAGFTLHHVPGDHFLIQEPPAALVSRLGADLLGAVRDGVGR